MRKALALIMIAASFPVAAEVYTWKDENGVTHFGNQPPAGQQQKEVEIRDSKTGSLLPDQRTQSNITRQAREIERRNRQEALRRAAEDRSRRLNEIRSEINDRPDYICRGARDRLENLEERWEDKRRRGYNLDEKRRWENRIERNRDHVKNICR